jgi:hypothetical protein
LRLVADGNISNTDLKDELNDKLSWKLQKAVAVYYNNDSINATTFARHCVTLDQQIRARTVKQERADKRAGGQGDKRKKASKESDEAKASKPEDDNKDKSKFGRDRSPFKCYNCDKIGHMSQDCRAPKKEDKVIAPVDEGTDSGDEQSGKARP